VYAVVQSHQGVIDVASNPDEGSVFRIFLPLSGRT
jgi:signal transduction histidine kinase